MWYAGGLHFACTRCGNCCTGGPGTVRVTKSEILALAFHLGTTAAEFRDRYARDVGDRDLSLRERPNHDCIFWNRRSGCAVYPVRPTQCRTWPFWHSVVMSRGTWADAAASCPGMNRGVLFDADYIERRSADDGTLGSARRLRRAD